jgi:F-type H+-transporting ATPase subunit delta
MNAQTLIARRYAIAFLKVFATQIQNDDIICSANVAQFITHNPTALALLNTRSISEEIKTTILKKLFAVCSTSGAWITLVTLLMRDRRLFLLRSIITHIQRYYGTYVGIEYCTILSAVPLSEQETEILGAVVASVTGKKVAATVVIEPNLIAGIALQGNTFFWEHSVRRQLLGLKKATYF